MANDDTPDALRRIARALDVPVRAFYDPSAMPAAGSAVQAAQDSSELLEAFARIEDPQVRRECIAFVRAKASCPSLPSPTPVVADPA